MYFITFVSIAVFLGGFIVRAGVPPATACITVFTMPDPSHLCPPKTSSCADSFCEYSAEVVLKCGCKSIFTSEINWQSRFCNDPIVHYITSTQSCSSSTTRRLTSTPHKSTTSRITGKTTTTSSPLATPPPPFPTPNYANSTTKLTTRTDTHIITITTCPPSTICTGQTVTYTSADVCPSTTCTCVLPTASKIESTTGVESSNLVPTPSNSTTTAVPTFVPSNGVVVRRWRGELGVCILGVVGYGFAVLILG